MIVLKMTSDYRQYLSGMTYAFQDAEGVAIFNEGYGEFADASTLARKYYTAYLTQTGTDAPVATEINNTIGDVTLSRTGVGVYTLTCSGALS